MTKRDLRLGKYGEYAPQLCAVTNQYMGARPHKTIKISKEYFCRVLSKVDGYKVSDIKKELLPLTKASAKQVVTETKASPTPKK